MKVFVSGATGVIGRRAVDQLIAAGHAVTGVARSPQKATALRAQGAEAAEIDPFDRDAMIAAAAGHEALVNLATHIPTGSDYAKESAWAENDRVRRDISANVAAAAAANGAARLVQESFFTVYADGGSEWVTEDSRLEPAGRLESALAAEQNARAADGVDSTVLRFALFYAADTAHMTDQLRAARLGVAPVMGSPDGYWPGIDADDAAAAVVAALSAPPGVYNVADDDPLTRGEYAAAFAAALGKKRASFLMPRLFGKLSENKTGGATRSLRLSNEKFKAASGWQPRWPSTREGITAAVKTAVAGH